MANKSDFDLDFRDGYAKEEAIGKLLGLDTVEVKFQRQASQTHNVFIETKCWQSYRGEWALSGISTSKATHWAFVLDNGLVLIQSRAQLLRAMVDHGIWKEMPTPPNPAWGYLVPIRHLIGQNNELSG